MLKKKTKENLFIIFLFILIMEYELFIVTSFTFDRIIKISMFVVLLLFRSYKSNVYIQRILILWIIFFSLVFFSTLINYNEATIPQFLKNLLIFSIFVIMLYKVRPLAFTDNIIKFPLFLGGLMALQATIMFILILSGKQIDFVLTVNERISVDDRPYNIFWGTMYYAMEGGYYGLMRAVGHFQTPSRFGTFLHYPFFIGMGYYMLTRKYRYLICSLISGLVILTTFSYAAYAGALAALIMWFVLSQFGKTGLKQSYVFNGILVIVITGLMLGLFMHFIQGKYESASTPFEEMLYRGGAPRSTFKDFLGEDVGLVSFIKLVQTAPLGLGFGAGEGAQYALFQWLKIAGFPAFATILFIQVYMYIRHVIPALTANTNSIERYMALCFMAQTINQVGEGTWLLADYLFTMAMLVLLKQFEFKSTYN